MKLNKHYDNSSIFSSIEEALGENENSSFTDVLMNINYLNSKNSTFNIFNNPDLYLILNFQNNGEIVFQKNNNLEVDGMKPSISGRLELVDPERIKVDAINDRKFVEFNVHQKVKPLDLIVSFKNIINTKTRGDMTVERSIAILSSNENGIPLFGLCCINKISEPKGTEIDKYNFRIKSTSNNSELAKQLEEYLGQTVTTTQNA